MTSSFTEGKQICIYLLLNNSIFHISLKTACKNSSVYSENTQTFPVRKYSYNILGKCLKGATEIRPLKC